MNFFFHLILYILNLSNLNIWKNSKYEYKSKYFYKICFSDEGKYTRLRIYRILYGCIYLIILKYKLFSLLYH